MSDAFVFVNTNRVKKRFFFQFNAQLSTHHSNPQVPWRDGTRALQSAVSQKNAI